MQLSPPPPRGVLPPHPGDVPSDGQHFHDWIDHNGVSFSRELLEWVLAFPGKNGKIHGNRKPLKDREIYICPKVTEMRSLIGERIDYNRVGVLRGQRHIPSKN